MCTTRRRRYWCVLLPASLSTLGRLTTFRMAWAELARFGIANYLILRKEAMSQRGRSWHTSSSGCKQTESKYRAWFMIGAEVVAYQNFNMTAGMIHLVDSMNNVSYPNEIRDTTMTYCLRRHIFSAEEALGRTRGFEWPSWQPKFLYIPVCILRGARCCLRDSCLRDSCLRDRQWTDWVAVGSDASSHPSSIRHLNGYDMTGANEIKAVNALLSNSHVREQKFQDCKKIITAPSRLALLPISGWKPSGT